MAVTMHERRRIGSTELSVPVLGFGSAHLGEMYGLVDESVSQATLNAAWDGGIRLYDTAPWYGRGMSEHRVGGFLRTKPRDEFILTSKVGRVLHRPKDPKTFDRAPWLGGFRFEVEFDYTRDGFMRAYEQQLQRLGVDTIDALIIHDLDSSYHSDDFARHKHDLVESGVSALEELKKSGDIKAIGMGINTTEAMLDTMSLVPLDFALVAMPYTLLDQSSLHSGMAEVQKRGMSAIIGAPFASGVLATGSKGTMKYGYANASEAIKAKVRGIEAVCEAHDVALPTAALHFPLAHPAVAALIPGAAKPEEIVQNLKSFAAPIPAQFWADLKTEGLIVADAPVPL